MSGVVFEVPPTSRAKIEELTDEIRRLFRIATPFFPLEEFVDLWLPRVWPEFTFSVGCMDEMGEDHGRTFPGNHHVMVRADVHEGMLEHRGRDRLTVAHELGHLFMHDDPVLARNLRRREDVPAYRSSEWQANAFGGSLLMPLNYLRTATSIIAVVNDCGVTIEAARTQIDGMVRAGLLRNPNL